MNAKNLSLLTSLNRKSSEKTYLAPDKFAIEIISFMVFSLTIYGQTGEIATPQRIPFDERISIALNLFDGFGARGSNISDSSSGEVMLKLTARNEAVDILESMSMSLKIKSDFVII
jgi:hypothetical protein